MGWRQRSMAAKGIGHMRSRTRLPDPAFWQGKRVLLTGHTGFKGAWTALWLRRLGARVIGLALAPAAEPNLFTAAKVSGDCLHEVCDLTDRAQVHKFVSEARPDVIVHMAAQALVRQSYRDPVGTISTNVLGTAHLLDAAAATGRVKAILVVTSDKVYANDESGRAFVESDPLGGHEPYAASKAACDIIVASLGKSLLEPAGIRVATARGGNVIGGGDFSADRIVPDIWRAACSGQPLVLRSPNAVRPWQHVLDCVAGYLCFAESLAADPKTPRALNIGPLPGPHLTVGEIATFMLGELAPGTVWKLDNQPQSKEMAYLSIDPALSRRTLLIVDRWPGRTGLTKTAAWYRSFDAGKDARELTLAQIEAYEQHGAAT